MAAARRHSMRLVGPNCLGVIANGKGLAQRQVHRRLPPPAAAVAAQSGGVGIALLDVARGAGLGIAHLRLAGQQGGRLAATTCWPLVRRPRHGRGALPGVVRQPRKFARIARAFSERKPVLASRAAAPAPGNGPARRTLLPRRPEVGVDALFAQAGVIAARTRTWARGAAARSPSSRCLPGAGSAIVGNAGGLGVLAADAAEALRPDGARPWPALRQLVVTPSRAAGQQNPVDAGARWRLSRCAAPPAGGVHGDRTRSTWSAWSLREPGVIDGGPLVEEPAEGSRRRRGDIHAGSLPAGPLRRPWTTGGLQLLTR